MITRIARVFLLAVLLATGGPIAVRGQEATPVGVTGDLTGVTPLALTGQRRAEFESYIAATLGELGVPGASVAVVQGGEVVFLSGFGVRAIGQPAPVTPDTLMMIGSVTKSMTSLMAATLVDDGRVSWETPVVELLPDFALSDPALTARLTLADLFCACTGVPRHDLELVFNADDLTPERLIESAAELPITAPYREKFQYSNQMYAIGGYAATIAAGAAPDDLRRGYRLAMQERVLNPVGMVGSTFTLEDVLTSGDYGYPHGANLAGEIESIPVLIDDRFVTSAGPAGALWSNGRDMARYVQMLLASGVAADGTRVVSEQNLAALWEPRVAIPADPSAPEFFTAMGRGYGRGWLVGDYGGQRLISHSGGTYGFVSQVALLPEADLGVVILTNGGPGAGPFTYAVQYRLFELLFDQPATIDQLISEYRDGFQAATAQLQGQVKPVEPVAVTPFLGRFANPTLGEIRLRLTSGRLILDAGEVSGELQALTDESGNLVGYVFVSPPLAGPQGSVTLRNGADGQPEVVFTVQGESTETYVFSVVT